MKEYISDVNVYEAAISRINYLCDHFEPREIWLSLSGGKDSTVCFHLMKEVFLSRGIKKINVLIIDLEGHYRLHNDFLEELVNDTEIKVRGFWVCLPFNLSNASSFHMPKWLAWDPDKKDLWVRPMPVNAMVINQDNNPFEESFRKGMEFEEFIIEFPKYLISCGIKKVAQIIGIRAQESFNRHLKMAVRKNREFFNGLQWIMKQKSTGQDTYSVHPIYDWEIEDVWKYLGNKSYNKVYDKMYLAGYPISKMRICQPYGEEQRDNIDLFSKIEPETWSRLTERVYGGNFAKLYKGKNILKGRIHKPDTITWEGWTRLILSTMPPFLREHYRRRINVFLRWWRRELFQDIESVYSREYAKNEGIDSDGLYVVNICDEHPTDTKKECPSWRRIAKVLLKGDYLCKNLTFCMNKEEYEKLQILMEKWQ